MNVQNQNCKHSSINSSSFSYNCIKHPRFAHCSNCCKSAGILLWLFSKRNTLQVAIRLEHHSSPALHQRRIQPSPALIIHSLNIKLAFVPLASHFAGMIFVILQITHFVLHPLNSMHSTVLFPFIRVQFYNMLPHFSATC